MTLADHHRVNLETLIRAAVNNHLAVIELRERATGRIVPGLVALSHHDDGTVGFTPFAIMVDCNPFEAYDPPDPEGGFHDGTSGQWRDIT